MAALELHVDLPEGIGDEVAQRHQAVVDAHVPYHQQRQQDQENDEDRKSNV